ncbi:MAG: hypothetical protein GY786_22705 [Proteobacteria bacterium]|nr:hypothetical protein [Pseudomonadota bacterium]
MLKGTKTFLFALILSLLLFVSCKAEEDSAESQAGVWDTAKWDTATWGD